MTTNQTIDGLLVPRELLKRAASRLWADGNYNTSKELRALLDAPDQCAHEWESPALSSMPDYCAKCSIDKPAVQPQGQPVADALSTGFYVTESGGGKYAINIGFRSMADMQAADQQLRDLLRARHAEQSAPVAVMPDGYCIMPRQLTAENGAKALLLGEFKLLATMECPECCELDEPTEGCSICDGEGEYGQKHTIPWDQIKFIYSKAVAGLALKAESAKSR